MAELFTGETKKFIYSFMSPFLKIPNRYIKVESKCSWSDVPKPTGPVPKSVELLYAQVATNILNKFQPDSYVHPG